MRTLCGLGAAVLLTAAAGLTFAHVVEANDCATLITGVQDLNNSSNIQDCIRTGQSYGMTVGIVVAVVGVVIGLVGLPSRRPLIPPAPRPPAQPQPPADQEPKPDPHQKPVDPCAPAARHQAAALSASLATGSALQILRSQRTYLDLLWEQTRESGFWSATFDLATLAGSAFTKPVAAGMGIAIARQSLASKVAEAGLKALGKELAKDLVKHLEDQGIDFSDLALKPLGGVQSKEGPQWVPSGASGKFYAEKIKDALTQLELNRTARRMLGTGEIASGAETGPLKRLIENNYSGPISEVIGHTVSVAMMGNGIFKSHEKLDAILKAIRVVDDHVIQLELRFEDTQDQLHQAVDELNRCRQFNPAPGT
jgi:hypothetical protein